MAELQNPDPLVEAVAKARKESSRRPDRSTTGGLNSTFNGKHFYLNSGLIAVDDTELSVIDIANIGERDIKIWINPILASASNDNMVMKVKNNSIIIYQVVYPAQHNQYMQTPIGFIIPANTSLDITFDNEDTSSWDVGVSCYGEYL